jgi:peptidoglycan/xylan/chitin deacetylase (PgdA/CDA1 family)
MGKKELLSQVLYRSGLLRVAASVASSGLTILTYHRIRPDGPSGPLLFDEDVFGPAQSYFDQQIKWLKQNTTVLSERELLTLIDNPHSTGSGRYTAVTFDDGYRDNYDLAYPVLRANSIPAIFFVCPCLLEERRVGWWDLIAYLVKESAKPAIELRGEILPFGESKTSSIRRLHGWMKSLPDHETADLLENLSQSTEVPLPSIEVQSDQLMTWEQVIEVSQHGVAIGSHTHTHRVLATLNEKQQLWELRESKAALERRLGQEVSTIAYPAGRHGNFTAASMRIAEQCGYRSAFSFHSGGNQLRSITPFDIHRIPALDSCDPMFKCSVIQPGVFA